MKKSANKQRGFTVLHLKSAEQFQSWVGVLSALQNHIGLTFAKAPAAGRQLCDIGSDASRLIAGEQPGRRIRPRNRRR
jgi:hypothetical protein